MNLKTCKAPIKFKSGASFDAGTVFIVTFETTKVVLNPLNVESSTHYKINPINAHKYFGSPFTKEPSEKTLEKWCDTAIARTITGHKCEPDGYGPDDSPSWLIALGLI